MAAGLLTIAHRSGGPLTDIIGQSRVENPVDKNFGFLAKTAEEYAQAISRAIKGFGDQSITQIRADGREAAARFSNDEFIHRWRHYVGYWLAK